MFGYYLRAFSVPGTVGGSVCKAMNWNQASSSSRQGWRTHKGRGEGWRSKQSRVEAGSVSTPGKASPEQPRCPTVAAGGSLRMQKHTQRLSQGMEGKGWHSRDSMRLWRRPLRKGQLPSPTLQCSEPTCLPPAGFFFFLLQS